MKQCNTCSLHGRTAVLPERGSPGCICLIGEAPGRKEELIGMPFVGTSGTLLRKLLRSIAPDEDYHFTNACLCRPDDNKTPYQRDVMACNGRLQAELSLVRPRVIIALGKTAAKAVLRTSLPITRLRNEGPFAWKGIPTYVTYHPAAALRNPDLFPDMEKDIRRAILRESTQWKKPRIVELTSYSMVTKCLNRYVPTTRVVALDLETTGLSPQKDKITALGFCLETPETAYVVYKPDTRILEILTRFLIGKKLVASNVKFDMQFLYAATGVWVVPFFDPMVAHYCLDSRKGIHSLDYQVTTLLHGPAYKIDPTIAGRTELLRYCGNDVSSSLQLYFFFRKELEKNSLLKINAFLTEVSALLADVEFTGIGVDTEYLTRLDKELSDEASRLYTAISEKYGINPNSPQQVSSIIYDKLKLLDETEVGSRTTRKEVIKNIYSEFTKDLLEYRTVEKKRNTFVAGIARSNLEGRVHTNYLVHGSVSRLSSANPNLQNVKDDPDILYAFAAKKHHTFVSIDFSQIELRVMAVLGRDEWLLNFFKKGGDLHSAVAAEFFGENFTEKERKIAKGINFGIPYGRGPASLAAELGIPYSRAKEFIDLWLHRASGVASYIKDVHKFVLEFRYVSEPWHGRRRYFPVITQENRHTILNEAVNFAIQTIANDITLQTALLARPVIEAYQSKLVRLVHDSLTYEVPTTAVDEVVAHLKASAHKAGEMFTDLVMFPIDIKQGERLSLLEKRSE